MKKLYRALAIGLLLFTQLRPVMAEESKIDVEPYSTAQYFWWKQDSNTFLRTESNGGWINYGDPFPAYEEQSVCFTPQSTAPTIGIDISIAGKVLAGGIRLENLSQLLELFVTNLFLKMEIINHSIEKCMLYIQLNNHNIIMNLGETIINTVKQVL